MIKLGSLWRATTAVQAGLDIGSSAVRLVELVRERGQLRLLRFGAVELAPGAVQDGQVEDVEAVAAAVRTLWQQCGTRARAVALAMPTGLVVTRAFPAPAALAEQEQEALAEVQAAQLLPLAREQVSLDFALRVDDGGLPELMLAAARQDQVSQRAAVAQAAGLNPAVMDIELAAGSAALLRSASEGAGTLALVHVGARSTQMAVLREGRSLYEREHRFGAEALVQALARHAGLAPDAARRLVRQGQWDRAPLARLHASAVASVAQALVRIVRLVDTAGLNVHLERLYLAGGGAHLPGLADALARHTGLPVALAQPFRGMASHALLTGPHADYLVACGLALRRFDRC